MITRILAALSLWLLCCCAVSAQVCPMGIPNAGCGMGVPNAIPGTVQIVTPLAVFDFRSSVSNLFTFSRGGTVPLQDFNSSKLLTSFGTTNPAQPVFNYQTAQPEGIGIWSQIQWRGTYGRDLTQAAWVKTNVTAALSQTGIDGAANSASLLTATAANGTAYQAETTSNFAFVLSAYVKRVTGSGSILMTLDGGATQVDISSCLNTSGYVRVPCNTDPVNGGLVQTLTNPTIGFKIVNSGDQIAVDYVQAETIGNSAFTWPTAPMLITSAGASTRSADSLTVPLSSIAGLTTDSFTIVIQYVMPYWETPTSTCYANATNCPQQAAMFEINDGTSSNGIFGSNQPGQYPSSCLIGGSPCDDDFNVQTTLSGTVTGSKARASTVPALQQTGLIHPVAGAIATVGICYNQASGLAISAANGAGSGPTPEVTTTNPGYTAGQLATWTLQVGSSKRISALNGYVRWLMVFNGCTPGNGTLTNQVSILQNY